MVMDKTELRQAITRDWCTAEEELVPKLLALATLNRDAQQVVSAHASALVKGLRQSKRGSLKEGLVQSLLQEYSLSTAEGVALMCLAGALLRVPDQTTRDALIRDKVRLGDWSQHRGHRDSLCVKATTGRLMV